MLLANHPLDCPVCDKGGECPLQDQAFSHGPGESRYVEEKRHFEKPIPISDLVFLDRERCILCDRCTRFADEVAGDTLIHFISRGNETQVNTFPDEPFASYFSGNTVQICPVGALTAKPYRFKARPWDLEQTESTCTTCSVGCRTVVQSSRDELLRYQGVDSDPVNWGWLCDRGRFNFEAVNSADRLGGADGARRPTACVPTNWNAALAAAVSTDHRGDAGRRCRRRSPCSAARAARTRTRSRGLAWPTTSSARRTSYAQMGDGLPVGLLGMPPRHHRRCCHRNDHRPARPRSQRRAAGPVPAPARRGARSGAAGSSSSRPKRSGLTRYAWKSSVYEPGAQLAAVQHRAGRSRHRRAARQGRGRRRRRPGQPGRVAATPRCRRCRRCSQRSPAPRCCRRCAAATSSARCSWACVPAQDGMRRSRRSLQAAADGKIECLVLLGCRSAGRLPRRRPGAAGDGRRARASSPSTRSSPSPARAADVVLAAAAYGEKARHDHQHRGSRLDAVAEGHAARHQPSRLDDRRRARRAARHRPRLASVDDVTAAIAPDVPASPTCRSTRCAPRATASLRGHAAVDRSDRHAGLDARRAQQLRLPPGGQPQAVRPGHRHGQQSRRWRTSPIGLRSCTCTRSTSSASASSTAPRSSCHQRARQHRVRGQSPTTPCCAAPRGCRSTSRAARIGELIDCHAAVTDVRIENL